MGLLGPICTSVKGGGEGSRGELEGETPPRPGEVLPLAEPVVMLNEVCYFLRLLSLN